MAGIISILRGIGDRPGIYNVDVDPNTLGSTQFARSIPPGSLLIQAYNQVGCAPRTCQPKIWMKRCETDCVTPATFLDLSGAATLNTDCCPGVPVQIDPNNPPAGVTFAEPESPTLSELRVAALALAANLPRGTKIWYGGNESFPQWLWGVTGPTTSRNAVLEKEPVILRGRDQLAIPNVLQGRTTPVGTDQRFNCVTVALSIAQDVTVTGRMDGRAEGGNIVGELNHGIFYSINGGIKINTGLVNAMASMSGSEEQQHPYSFVVSLPAGTSQICIDGRVLTNTLTAGSGSIRWNQARMTVTYTSRPRL